MAKGFFEEAYSGLPPWDIGRPQGEVARMAREGGIRGRVLDAGCGTGDNALFLARLGYDVTAIDAADTAIRRAKEKSRREGIPVNFLVWDALELYKLEKRFDTVMDCGLFHVFSNEERVAYVGGLHSVLVHGGTFRMLCFSEMEPGEWGPRRVTQEEIRTLFADGWKIDSIRPARFETNLGSDGCSAWLSSVTRIGPEHTRSRVW